MGNDYLRSAVASIIDVRQNEKGGVVSHRSGVLGDYDLKSENEVVNLLRQTK